jgi:hypothetical protein
MTTMANPNQSGWGAFMNKLTGGGQTGQGMLNSPMFGLGVGLLQGAMPGGTLGSGLQAGLLNAQQMQQTNQMAKLRDLQTQQTKMRVDEMQRQQEYQDKLRAQGAPDWIGKPAQEAAQVPYQMSEAELFPEEPAPTGLLTQQQAQPATGMYAQNPAMAGLLQQQYEYDPMGTSQKMTDALIEQQATSGQAATKFAYDSALQAQKDAAAAGKPMVVGKGGTVWSPGTGFISPSGGVVQPDLSDTLALKKQAQPRMDMFRKVAQSGENIKANIVRAGAFSDVNTLVSAIKVLDPESVVREGEVALPINTSGIWNALQSKVQQAQGQGFLTDTMKRDIAGSIDALLRTYEKAYQDVRSEYQPLAQDYGIDLQRVIGNEINFPTMSAEGLFGGGGEPIPGAPATTPAVDEGMQKYGGQ